MLEIGENTYVTLEEADRYVATYYSEKHPLRAHWEVCPTEYKERYLLQSMQEIEALPFVGRKAFRNGRLQFPRSLENIPFRLHCHPLYGSLRCTETEVPQEVKDAQTENAIGIIRKEYKPTVKAVVLSVLGLIPPESDGSGILSSKRAEELLRPFLGSLRV